jgi:hypothetical protein
MRTGVVLLAAAVLAGCGGSSGDSGLTASQRQALVSQLETVRGAAAARDANALGAAVDRFRSSVARLRRSGALTDQQARALRIGAARVVARFQSDNAAAPPAATSAPPATPPPKQKQGKGHGKGHNKHGGEGDEQ